MCQRAGKLKSCPRLSYMALVLILLFVSAPAMAEQLMVPSGPVMEFSESQAAVGKVAELKSTAENNQSVTRQIEFPKIEAEIGLSAG